MASKRAYHKLYELINRFCIVANLHIIIILFFISERVTSEEWIICIPGAYLPDVYEEVNSLAQIFSGIF